MQTQPNQPAPPSGNNTCPACGQRVSPTDRFCLSCGAKLGTATPPPAAAPTAPGPAPPMDIRERVDQDRGALKKLQLLIPGYRAYRLGEDVRTADALLRLQVADRLAIAMQKVDSLRSQMAREGVSAGLSDIGGLRVELQRIEGQVRHAEQGYTGISPAVRITPEKLDRLYERDWSFIALAEGVVASIKPIEDAVAARDTTNIATLVNALRDNLKNLENNFATRVMDVEKILQ